MTISAINTSGSMPVSDWVHLLKHDTSYGVLSEEISFEELKSPQEVTDNDSLIGFMVLKDTKIPIFAQRDPEKLPWKEYLGLPPAER